MLAKATDDGERHFARRRGRGVAERAHHRAQSVQRGRGHLDLRDHHVENNNNPHKLGLKAVVETHQGVA